MDKELQNEADIIETTVTIEGNRLLIIAVRQGPAEWSLTVQNERGVNSHWCEFFSSARKGIEHAKQAIKDEGVDAFVNVEGFEYLNE